MKAKLVIAAIVLLVVFFVSLKVQNEYVEKFDAVFYTVAAGAIGYYVGNDGKKEFEDAQKKAKKNAQEWRQRTYRLAEENGGLEKKISSLTKQMLCNEIAHLQKDKAVFVDRSAKDLAELIYSYRSYYASEDFADVTKETIEHTVRIALHAEEGLLDIYQGRNGEYPLRKMPNGEIVPMSEEEVFAIEQKDYGFILDL